MHGAVGRMADQLRQRLYFIFIILSILFQSLSGIFSKYVLLSMGQVTLTAMIGNIYYLLMIICLMLQALVWQQALKHYDISYAYPFMSIVNFVVLILSFFLFNEGITLPNIFGLAIISCGVYVLFAGGVKA